MGEPRRFEFRIGDVFPSDDPVSRWLVTISVGLNDIILANKRYEAGEKDFENLYFFRLACTHLWELAKFISDTYRAWPEIRAYVDDLSTEAREHFEALKLLATTGDVASVGKELVQVRDLFGHYQEMDPQERHNPRDPLTKGLAELADSTGDIELGSTVGDVRLGYADEVIGKTVLRLLPDEEKQKRVLAALAEGVGHALAFVQMALDKWLEPRMDKLSSSSGR